MNEVERFMYRRYHLLDERRKLSLHSQIRDDFSSNNRNSIRNYRYGLIYSFVSSVYMDVRHCRRRWCYSI